MSAPKYRYIALYIHVCTLGTMSISINRYIIATDHCKCVGEGGGGGCKVIIMLFSNSGLLDIGSDHKAWWH